MEPVIRAILAEAVQEPADADDLFGGLLDRFGEIGGAELELPSRATRVRSADLAS